ncbi:MAG: substrate-binding domain-containing protein [Spirochaetales bacterium]|nr:substrate-binding domain-containing protein [Spirochaetales bacterium]
MSDKRITIGLVIESLRETGSYHNKVWLGVMEAAQEEDVDFVCCAGGTIGHSPYNKYEKYRNIIYKFVSPDNVDGIVFTGATIGTFITEQEMLTFLDKYKPLPMISIGGPFPGYVCSLVDNEIGMYEVCKHLVDTHDYKKIAYISGPENQVDAIQRLKVYKKVLQEYGIAVDSNLIYNGNFLRESGGEAIREFLDKRKLKFDAVVAANDNMALGAASELMRRGMKIPYDVAVVGYDNIQETQALSITTVEQPVFEQSKKAAKLLIKKIKGEHVHEAIIGTKPVYRRSCGCVLASVSRADLSPIPVEDINVINSLAELVPELQYKIRQRLEINLDHPLSDPLQNLCTAFFDDLSDENNNTFLLSLDNIIQSCGSLNIDLTLLHDAISLIREVFLPHIADDASRLKAENMLHKARVLISEQGVMFHLGRSFAAEAENYLLSEVTAALSSTFDLHELLDVIAVQLPQLGISSCYISLFKKDKNNSLDECELVFAYDDNKREKIPEAGVIYKSKELFPPTFKQIKRFNYMAYPLHFRENYIGFFLLQGNTKNSYLYESIYIKLCSAMQGTDIFRHNQENQTFLKDKNSQIQKLVAPMIESINKVAEICTTKTESIKQITKEATASWSSISKSSTSVEDSREHINQMVELIKMIDEISLRINLIALNASIEAVHVGAKGKGFTVIAKEIRKLSDATNQRLADIMNAIKSVEGSVQDSVDVVKQSQVSFGGLKKEIDVLLNAFEVIAERMNELSTYSNVLIGIMGKKE